MVEKIAGLLENTLTLLRNAIRLYEEDKLRWVAVCLNCQKIIYVKEEEYDACEKKRHTVLYLDRHFKNNGIYGARACLTWLRKHIKQQVKESRGLS